MEGKKLDLDAPLLSIRRITAQAECEKAAPRTLLRRKSPFFDSDQKAGLVGSPGTVPFVWETTPGQPKDRSVGMDNVFRNPSAPKLPPGRGMNGNGADWSKRAPTAPESEKVLRAPTSITCSLDERNEAANVEDDEEVNFRECFDEDDAFSDAREAFSCAESFSMKCSTSAGAGGRVPSKGLNEDPHFKDVMMDRFLPAAQAVAAGSLQRTWKKPLRAPVVYCENSVERTIQHPLPLDCQYQLSRAQLPGTVQEEEDVEEYDGDGTYAGSRFFSANGCGLIHRLFLKNSLGIFNPVSGTKAPGTKAQGKPMPRSHDRPSPQTKVLSHASFGQTKDEDSWEAVYRYKLSRGYFPHKGEEWKLSESNQLTSWSDSQMLDGSSFLNSTISVPSPEKHEDPKRETGSWRRGSSDSCERDHRRSWETTSSHERLQGSGSTSPANKKHFHQDSFHLQEMLDSKSSENIPLDTNTMIKSRENSSVQHSEFKKTEECVVSEPGFSSCCERLNGVEVDGNDLNNNDDSGDGLALKVSLLEKKETSLALSLLPPPSPTSPSESWLLRTLPSVSSKGPHSHQQSFLGIQLHPKKQVSWTSTCDKSIAYEKPYNMHPRRTRFANVTKDA